jgi:F-type H+-transporting ATPase subunit c
VIREARGEAPEPKNNFNHPQEKNMSFLAQAVATNPSITGNIAIGLAAAGSAIGIGLVGGGASQAVGRNPGAFGVVITMAILAIALSEGLFFIVAFLFNK